MPPIMGWGAALLVVESYRLIPWYRYSSRVNSVDPAKVQCNTGNPGVTTRTGLDGSRLRTDP